MENLNSMSVFIFLLVLFANGPETVLLRERAEQVPRRALLVII